MSITDAGVEPMGGAEGVTAGTAMRPSKRQIMVSADGAEAPIHGVYREVAKPERLVFTTGDPDNTRGEVASVVTVTLTDLGGATRMVFHQAGYSTDHAHANAAKAGWLEFFERLAEYLAYHQAQGRVER